MHYKNALVTYADDGGGVIALHHGLYNESEDVLNKEYINRFIWC